VKEAAALTHLLRSEGSAKAHEGSAGRPPGRLAAVSLLSGKGFLQIMRARLAGQAEAKTGKTAPLPTPAEKSGVSPGTAEEAAHKASPAHGAAKKTTAEKAGAEKHSDHLARLLVQGLAGTQAAGPPRLEQLKSAPAVGSGNSSAEGSEGSQRAEASRAAAAQRGQPRIQIVDLRRTSEGQQQALQGEGARPSKPASGEKESGPLLGARLSSLRDQPAPEPVRASPGASTQFSTALDRLRATAGTELVKAGGIVLRDGGGEIRLVLKPESLGSIRIRMNLVDNHIEGRIIVDSSAVKHVIDGSVDALARALTAEGFQTASLSVSVSGQQAEDGRADREQAQPVPRAAVEGFQSSIPDAQEVALGDLLVNLFV
jgi:flagellar hook-length control protein FliK